jgi:hypothetical protein
MASAAEAGAALDDAVEVARWREMERRFLASLPAEEATTS